MKPISDIDASRRVPAAARRTAALLSDRRGSSSLVAALLLLGTLALGGMSAIKALQGSIRERADCAAQTIASLNPGAVGCPGAATPPGAPTSPELEQPLEGPNEGPAILGGGPVIALPFPGSVSVACTGGFKGQKDACKGQTGVRVQMTGELSIERSQTKLDSTGCPTQDLSVGGKLQVELSGSAKGKTLGGSLTEFVGKSTKYKVTVSPEAADQIERFQRIPPEPGSRPPPNPLDPSSIGVGEGVEMSEEFFAGVNMTATYRQLQISMGFEEGRRLSSGVKRTDDNHVRIYVGDADFVRHALSLGASLGDFGISIGSSKELSNGKLRAVDIDISTQAGWDAYQQFLATGKLPDQGAPGTSDPTVTESVDISESAKLEGKLGPIKVGGSLGQSDAHFIETKHADGTVDTSIVGGRNDVGLAIKETRSPDGKTKKSFSLLIEGADPRRIGDFEHFSGRSLHASPDGNVRLDFTEDDLRQIQDQAMDQLFQMSVDKGFGLSREEFERMLREDPRRLEMAGLSDPQLVRMATAKNPEEVLLQLYSMGQGGNPDVLLDNLTTFMMATTRARHGIREDPRDHPDSVLPGKAVAPKCK